MFQPSLFAAAAIIAGIISLSHIVAAILPVPGAAPIFCNGKYCRLPYDGWDEAMRHPNATGTAPFEGFDAFKKDDTDGGSDLWNWTVRTVDFHIPNSDRYIVGQHYDLHIPLDFQVTGPGLARNVCIAMPTSERAQAINPDGENPPIQGKCEGNFTGDELDAMADRARQAVGREIIPCAAALTTRSGDFIDGDATNIISPLSSEPADRTSTLVAGFLFTTINHTADDTTLYDKAINKVQPMFMMSYPAEWNSSITGSEADSQIKTKMVCIYSTDDPKRPNGDDDDESAASVLKPTITMLWSFVLVSTACIFVY